MLGEALEKDMYHSRRTDGYLSSSRRTIRIPEGACELVEGMGFHNLEIRCTLPFQNKKGLFSDEFKKFEVSYILDEKLYLLDFYVTEMRVKGYELNLRMIKELSVRYKAKLFDDVEEDIVQVVFDKGEVEKEMIGEEDYGSYLKFISQKPFYF